VIHRSTRARLLVVDDDSHNRAVLSALLAPLGHDIVEASDGTTALRLLETNDVDLVLLDLRMPGLDGIDVLLHLRARPEWAMLPVVLVTAQHDRTSRLRGLQAGADDFLEKPLDPAILRARVHNLLLLKGERERSESLLLNVLPASVAERLKRGETIADTVPDVSVLFADIVGFTELAAIHPPEDTVRLLNTVFSAFDQLADAHQLEKIKTIGDAYLAVGGLFGGPADHTERAAAMALDMIAAVRSAVSMELRVGIHTGRVVAGVVGTKRFSYDVWGDTVNVASRMESQGVPGRVQVSAPALARLQHRYRFEERPHVAIKGKGEMTTWLLVEPLVEPTRMVEGVEGIRVVSTIG
jgi:adenylate cyclase